MKKQIKAMLFAGALMLTGALIGSITANAETPEIKYIGKDGGVEWSIDANGHLLLTGEGDYVDDPDWMDSRYRFEVKTATVKVKNMTSMESMFDDCQNLKSVDFSQFDSSNVTSMRYLFYYCHSLTDPDLEHLKTDKVTTMYGMFYDCNKLRELDLSHFKTSNVTDMGKMFKECTSLHSLDLSSFDTSKVEDMVEMFYDCYYLEDLDVSHFKTANVYDMGQMFYYVGKTKAFDLSAWDLSSLREGGGMLGAQNVVMWKLPNLPIDLVFNGEYVDETNQVTTVAKAEVGSKTYRLKKYADTDCGKNGHSYGKPVFIWTADYTEVNVHFVCSREDCDYNNKITLPAVITSQTVAPTSEKEGATIYTATVVFEGKTYTDVRSVAIAKLPAQEQPATLPTKPVGTALNTSGIFYRVVKVGKAPELAYIGPKNRKVKTVKIPAVVKIDGVSYKVTSVADGALKNYKKLTKVTIGANVTKIGKNAFYGCKKLKTIVIKTKKLKSVGKNALRGISKNAKIDVPNNKKKEYKKLLKSKTGYKKTMSVK